jgi:RHS repeat-associated protein
MPSWHATQPRWPAGSGQALLGTGAAAAGPASSGAARPARAGTLPVWIAPATSGPTAGASRSAAGGPAGVPPRVSATIASRAAARSAGVTGVLFSVRRDDGVRAAEQAQLTLGYGQFADAFGGDWASRLRLAAMPACALTTPDVPGCRVQTPLRSSNNAQAATVAARVSVPAAGPPAPAPLAPGAPAGGGVSLSPAQPAATMVIAASSSPGGGAGDYTATSLQPSGSWQAGGSADPFSWSYPIPVPTVPGGLVPTVRLSYDSQSQDGLTSSTNNQASVVGDGWQLPQSYVERSYQSCHQNPAGTTQTWDNCWSASNTLTLSLNGSTSTLIKDDTTGAYHPADDSSERVQYKTGAVNGAQNGEYFVVTTTDGTQYYFGLGELPGWASGDAATNSVFTEPVYATASGQPCYNATFASSWCQQAYRWNLDYVVDTHSNAVSYFYNTETNYYARDLGSTANTSYIRGGYLSKIQYGQRAGAVYTSTPAAQVLFTVNGRCDTSPAGCATSTLTSSTQLHWPDVPYDLNCANGAACSTQSPTFWSEYELTAIQTEALVGSTQTKADSFALTYSFPATGDSTKPSLWLSTVTRTGQDAGGGGSSSPIILPPVTFTGTGLANRVNLTDGYPPITRHRLNTIITETGEVVSVGYSLALCPTCTPADDSTNTTLAYPDWWTPGGLASPIKDYFNKYIVTAVTVQDPTGGSANDTIVTSYTPVGSPAWHYNDNPVTPASQRTWDQWRGYQGMTVSTGTGNDPVTKATATYFRGMNGDTLPGGGTRSVSITDSRGDPPVTDSSQYVGMTYEAKVFNGSATVTDTITGPWSSPATATHALTGGLPDQQAFITGTADKKVYAPLADGTTRETETGYTHDSYGRVTKVNDLGDMSTAADDLCTTTSYADNTSAWILNAPAEVKTVSVNCSTTPSLPGDAVSDVLSFYDGSTALGAAPGVGDLTMSKKAASYTGSTANYVTTQTRTVDQYGRVTAATDADGRKTSTAYTPATGAEPTSVKVTDPMTFATTTAYDPVRELPTQVTTPASYVTSLQYDTLGRLTAVYKPGQTSPSPPNVKYSYTISASGPSVVDTYTLNDDGTFRLSETLYDSLLRARETQTQTPDNGRLVSDTMYNTDGWKSESTDPYFTASPVSVTLVQAQVGQVPSATGYTYDQAGRQTAAIAYALGTQTWQTTTSYGGNFVTTVPPAGATATTTVTDARGHTTDLIQYHAGVPADYVNDPPADYSDTRYTYYPNGQKATQADPAGNTWSWQYNLFGYQTQAQDPDTGTATSTYDNAGQMLSTTDARGDQTTATYDLNGRVTATYDTTSTQTLSLANQLTGYTYDTLKKGLPTSATSYSGGDTYTSAVLGYNTMAEPAGTKVTLTGEGTTLVPAAGLITSYGYTLTGRLQGQQDPAAGGLPGENIQYGYDQFGEPTSVTGSGGASWDYVTATGYSEYGQPLQYTFGPSTSHVWAAMTYDPQTRNLTNVQTTDSTTSGTVDALSYGFGNSAVSQGAGLLTSTTDKQNAGTVTDTQCYTYDYAQHLQAAWTATDSCAATPSPGNSASVGGPVAPYWQSWTYDAAGDRATQTDHDTTGNTAGDTAATYSYPAAGSATDQPHTLTSTTATGPGAAGGTASYVYDAAGNTTSITGGTAGNQALTWNHQDKLASDQTTAGTTGYVYGPAGNVVVRRDPGQTTLYTGDEQIVLNTAANTVSATRYYSIGGVTIAARATAGTSTGKVAYLIPDRQGTSVLAIDATTQAVTRRQYLPFGAPRGTARATWPGDKGYVGGSNDTATSLETLGARQYDTATGRFLSADPVFEASDPQQAGGYDYAANDPVTGSDPTGLLLVASGGGGDSSPSDPICYYCHGPSGGGGGGGGDQGLGNAVAGGIVSAGAGLLDGILNFPADVVAMHTHAPPAYHISLSGAWDHLWEKRTGIQAGSLNDWMLHKTSTVVSIATLLIPGIDAASGIADTLRGASAARALAAAAEASGVRVAPEAAAPETFFRTMSKVNFEQLQTTGRVPATSETFISPSQEYARGYNGVTVKFSVRAGTQDALAGIGIRDSSAVSSVAYPDMPSPQNFSGWTRTSAYFKGEGGVLNIGLGRGPALDIFNDAILGFEVVP